MTAPEQLDTPPDAAPADRPGSQPDKGLLQAGLVLRRPGQPLVGRDRIDLLEAVQQHGSISKAARAVGLTYKAAWDALNAVNNLLPRPAVLGQAGGRQGGGARVTDDGLALIAAFRLLERKLEAVTRDLIDGSQTTDGGFDPLHLLAGLGLRVSSRNSFRCTVESVRRDGIEATVRLRLSPTATLTAQVTADSVERLGIVPGAAVLALIKACFVTLADPAEPLRLSARNRIAGTVIGRQDSDSSCEITLDIGGGRTLSAMITREGADALALAPGVPAQAIIKANHIILAVG